MLVDYHCHLAPDDGARAELHDRRVDRRLRRSRPRARYRRARLDRALPSLHPGRGDLGSRVLERDGTRELDSYVDALAAARDEGKPIRVGLELDWLGDDRVAALRALIDGRDLDIVLGSVHWLAGAMVDHPGYSVWESHSVEDVWRLYFDELRRAASSGLYDVMAHPDLPKVFGHRPPGRVAQREYDDTAEAFAAAGVSCEVSSAGLRKAAAELYPAPPFLDACARRGVPITLAADGHRPEDVGRGLDEALRLAVRAGYRTVTAFRGREPRQEPLG